MTGPSYVPRSVNHGGWWLGGILGGIATIALGGIALWALFVLLWAVFYAAASNDAHRANQRAARGIPDKKRWQGIGPKLTDEQKPSWW